MGSNGGGGARWPSGLERWLGMATGHSRLGSNPTSVKTFCFGTLAIPFILICQCLSEETLKASRIDGVFSHK